MNIEFSFEESLWEQKLAMLQKGETLDALQFLMLTEEEDIEQALDSLEEKGVVLDISGLGKLPTTEETALRLRREAELTKAGKLMTDLAQTDPLRLYLEEVAAAPAFGDVQVMAEDYLGGNEEMATPLVNAMLSEVIARASVHAGEGVLLLDLIGEGSLGLWQAILHYAGGDFTAHCRYYIDFYLARALVLCAKDAGIGERMRQGMQDYLDTDQKLLIELGRNPTLQEIAEALRISEEEVYALASAVEAARAKSRVEEEREEKQASPEDALAVEDTAYFQSRQRIAEMLSRLSEQEAQLVSMRFGLDRNLPMTPEETGKKLKLTPEQVLQMEATALKKLKEIG